MNTERRAFGRRWLLLLVVIVCLLGFFYWQIGSWWKAGEVAGIYLTKGGRSLVVLERGWFPTLRMVEGYFPTISTNVGQVPQQRETGARISDGRLVLSQIERYEGVPTKKDKGRVYLGMELVPSKTIQGDWDLVGGEYLMHYPAYFLNQKPAPPGGSGWGVFQEIAWSAQVRWREFAGRYKPELLEPDVHMAIQEEGFRGPSFLHRIDDVRLIDYFNQRARGVLSPEDLENFRATFADHRDDPYLLVHAIDVEARYGDLERAVAFLEEWNSRRAEIADELLKGAAMIAEKSVATQQGLPWGRDLDELLAPFLDENVNLAARIKTMKEFLLYNRMVGTTRPLVEPTPGRLVGTKTMPNFLDLQINARVLRTVGQLELFQGRPRESLDLLAGLYQQGNMLNADGVLIQRLIGFDIRGIALAGIRLAVLNACESPEYLDYALRLFDAIERSSTPQSKGSLLGGEMQVPRAYMEDAGGSTSINTLETWIRHRIMNMYFATTRAAAAAKWFYLEHGRYPGSPEEYRRYLDVRLPRDEFGKKGEPLRFSSTDSDPYLIYSVGPDETDDEGKISYSATNGTKSVGDLFVEVTTNRKYPFPPEGIGGLGAQEILDLFPEGLPIDGFSGNGADPLSVMYAAPEIPPTVFGFGPSGTQGTHVTNVRMFDIPGMIPKEGHGGAMPVNTGIQHPNIQYLFYPGNDPDQDAREEERRRRWEALTEEEREAIEFHRIPPFGGMYPQYSYGGKPSPYEGMDTKETKERQAQRMAVIQRLEAEWKLDPSLYPSSERPGPLSLVPYDPTNGIKSEGQIMIETEN